MPQLPVFVFISVSLVFFQITYSIGHYSSSMFFLQDFATRSLNMSEETPIQDADQTEPDVNVQFQMRRTWESRFVFMRVLHL